jgi:hypothetical protein
VNYLRTLNRQRKRIVLGIIKIGIAYEAKKDMTVYWHGRYDGMANIIESLPVKTLTKENFNHENCLILGEIQWAPKVSGHPRETYGKPLFFARRKSGQMKNFRRFSRMPGTTIIFCRILK